MKFKLFLALAVLAICVCPVLSHPQFGRAQRLPQIETPRQIVTVLPDGQVIRRPNLRWMRQLSEPAISFPGGEYLLLPNQQFTWEAADVSGLFPSQVETVKIESVVQAPAGIDAKVFLTVETLDHRYYLFVIGDNAARGFARALNHGGFCQ